MNAKVKILLKILEDAKDQAKILEAQILSMEQLLAALEIEGGD